MYRSPVIGRVMFSKADISYQTRGSRSIFHFPAFTLPGGSRTQRARGAQQSVRSCITQYKTYAMDAFQSGQSEYFLTTCERPLVCCSQPLLVALYACIYVKNQPPYLTTRHGMTTALLAIIEKRLGYNSVRAAGNYTERCLGTVNPNAGEPGT